MSYATIKALWPGERQEDLKILKNAWGAAPFVWDVMCQKYLNMPPQCYLFDAERLWPLYKNVSIPRHHRAVLLMTYDRAYIGQKDYQRASKDILDFLIDFFPYPGEDNHWTEISGLLASQPDCPAIGFHATSVTENPFQGEWDEELDDYSPFDWGTAFDVYDKLEKIG